LTILLFTFLSLLLLNTPAWAFNEAHLKKLQTLGECQKCDLSGATLWFTDLSKVNLFRANLTGATLQEADLKQAILYASTLTGANLRNANLTQAYLGEAKLDGAKLCKTLMPSGVDNSGCQDYPYERW